MTGMENNPELPNHEIAPVYQALRAKLLELDPVEVGFQASREHPTTWGVLMETHYPEGVVTQAALLDGTTSLYFSTGGGILGSGNQAQVGKAARAMLAVAEAHLELTHPVKACPLPPPGRVAFHLLTYGGLRTAQADVGDLVAGTSPLAALYRPGRSC